VGFDEGEPVPGLFGAFLSNAYGLVARTLYRKAVEGGNAA